MRHRGVSMRVNENGVICAQEPNEMYGAKKAQYLDPDGLVISVGEASRSN